MTASSPTDRTLTTLAVLKVNYDSGRGYLDNYLPFFYHCLAHGTNAPISRTEIRRQIENEFGLDLPGGVIKSLIGMAVDAGKVRLRNGVLFPEVEALADLTLDEQRESFLRGLNALATQLAAFANEQYQLAWDAARAKVHLVAYADHFSSDLLANALVGKALPTSAPHDVDSDSYIVQRFVLEASEADPSRFELLVTLAKGRMLADAIYFEGAGPEPQDLSGVEFYIDGPVLLYALGYAGREVQTPYEELLSLLRASNAPVRCFVHSVEEAQQILDAAEGRVQTGAATEKFYGDVVGFLVRSQASPSDIAIYSDRLESDLDALGIATVETPAWTRPELTPDETRLEDLLKRRFRNVNPVARRRDIASLLAIDRLRQGKTARTISRSQAVLVTHQLRSLSGIRSLL